MRVTKLKLWDGSAVQIVPSGTKQRQETDILGSSLASCDRKGKHQSSVQSPRAPSIVVATSFAHATRREVKGDDRRSRRKARGLGCSTNSPGAQNPGEPAPRAWSRA